MRRAYRPSNATLETLYAIANIEGVSAAHILAPHRGVHPTRARIRIVYGESTHDLSLADARAFVANRTTKPERTWTCGGVVE